MHKLILTSLAALTLMLGATNAFALTSEQGASPSGTYNNLADPDEKQPAGLQAGGMHFNMTGGGGNSNSQSYGRPSDDDSQPTVTAPSLSARQQQMQNFNMFGPNGQ